MSVAQLEKELPTFNGSELAALEAALRREKGRRKPNVLSREETRLHEIINQPMPQAERFAVLTQKWEEVAKTRDTIRISASVDSTPVPTSITLPYCKRRATLATLNCPS